MTSKRSNTASAKGRDISPGIPARKGSVMEEVVRVPAAPGQIGLRPEPASGLGHSATVPSRDMSDAAFLYAAARHFEHLPTHGEDSAHWANVYNAMNCRRIADDLQRCERAAVARCIAIARETRDGFLSEEYAVDQPLSSFQERFACDQIAQAIENEFAMGTIEQCQLLGKPTPFERHRDSDASLAEDAKRLSPEGVAARAEGIAKGDAA